jgi:hypothetical protein
LQTGEADGRGQRKNEIGRSRLGKGNLFKWLENYAARKRQAAVGTVSTTNAMRIADRRQSCSTHQATTSSTTSESPQSPLEMSDFEDIILDFEKDYLSPSKQDGATNGRKQKNFVRKIVEAFEVKYKVHNDSKATQSDRQSQEGNKSNIAFVKSWRKSNIFRKAFKSDSEESRASEKLDSASSTKQNSRDADESGASPSSSENNSAKVLKRVSRIFDWSVYSVLDEGKDAIGYSRISEHQAEDEEGNSAIFRISCNNNEVEDEEENSAIFRISCNNNEVEDPNCSDKPWIFSPAFNRRVYMDASSSGNNCSSPVNLDHQGSKNSNSDSSSLFNRFDKTESDRGADNRFDSVKASTFDETKTMDSHELDAILSEETIFIADDAVRKTSTMIDESPKSEHHSMLQEISRIDESPKVVGAFLKDPIDVENTPIDWVPITGKKLPRKTSLRKLLCSWSGRKLDKRFFSERNLYEQLREFQDSGYDEKSPSTSLNSLLSIAEVLLRQENSSYFEFSDRNNLKTFKSNVEENEASCSQSRSVA